MLRTAIILFLVIGSFSLQVMSVSVEAVVIGEDGSMEYTMISWLVITIKYKDFVIWKYVINR